MSIRNKIITVFVSLTLILSGLTWLFKDILVGFMAALSIIALVFVIHDVHQTQHALLRNYPLLARLRWLFESERSKIQQYFIEHDTNGTPYNREKRSDIYQKAKGEINTTPFGTQLDVYKEGYEFVGHSMYPKDISLVE